MREVGVYRFGPFELDRAERVVLCEGEPVAVRGKAFELLELLVLGAGRLVDKPALLRTLWPGIHVHDNNIAVTVRSLRRALSRHRPAVEYVETVPRRGYRLSRAALPIGARDRGAVPPATAALSLPAAPEEGATACVGRARELELLDQRWSAACAGLGQVTFVGGEPGIGKSVLVRRFVERLLAGPGAPIVLTGDCVPLFGSAEPYLPLVAALAAGLAGDARGPLLAALEAHAPGWLAALPGVRAPGSSCASSAGGGEAPGERRPLELVFALRALARARRLVLVLEDLHWADASSVDVLRLACGREGAPGLFVLGTFRTAEAHAEGHPLGVLLREWVAQGRRAELELRPWTVAQLEEYVRERLGPTALARDLGRALWEQTEGLPLFAARLLDSLLERAVLERSADGEWRLAEPRVAVDWAERSSIQALIQSQLARLPARALRALEVASVEGTEFGTALLSALLREPALEVEAELEHVRRSHGLVERVSELGLPGGGIDVRYRFCHALYQSFLYSELGAHRRLELHRAVVAASVALGGSRSAPARVAFHWERGREFSRAVACWIEAGDRADRSYAKVEALACYDRAEALLAELPVDEAELRRLLLAHGRGWANLGLGRLPHAREQFAELARRAEALCEAAVAERAPRELALARAYFEQPWSDSVLARPATIFPELPSASVELELHAEALHCCCHVAFVEDRCAALREHAEALRRLAERSGSEARRAEGLAWLGAYAIATGDARAARASLEEALRLARQLPHERALRVALPLRARLHLLRGELEAARLAHEELLARVPDAPSASAASTFLGEALAKLGRPRQALAAYARAHALRQRVRPGFPELHGWLLRELGQLGEARALDEAAVGQLSDGGDADLLRRTYASLSLTCCRAGDGARAREHLARAEAHVAPGHHGCSWRMGASWAARVELEHAAGRLHAVARHARRWLVSARARGDVEGMCVARRWLAIVAEERGDLEGARAQLGVVLASCQRRPMPLLEWRARALESRIAERLGRAVEAAAARRKTLETVAMIAAQLDHAEARRAWQRHVARELGAGGSAARGRADV